MAGSNMYGTPLQTYVVLGNVSYRADGTGLIANVAEVDVAALVDKGCMSEAQWLKVQAAHPGLPLGGTAMKPISAPRCRGSVTTNPISILRS
jgi:hypothetical protein